MWDEVVETSETLNAPITSGLVQTTFQRHLQSCQSSHLQSRQPVHLQSNSVRWFTPFALLEVIRQAFTGGQIDLDPCSEPLAQAVVQAQSFFTQASDGLVQPWFGRVYVNPPFGRAGSMSVQGQFFAKAVAEYIDKHALEVVLLLKVAVGYAWFHSSSAVSTRAVSELHLLHHVVEQPGL